MRPVAYLWTRTVPCPNPALPAHELHLVRQTWLVKKKGKGKSAGKELALRLVGDSLGLKMSSRVVKAAEEDGFMVSREEGSGRGDAAWRLCGATVRVEEVRRLGHQGKIGVALLGIAAVRHKGRGKEYLGSEEAAQFVPQPTEIGRRLETLVRETGIGVPDTALAADDPRAIAPPIYGLNTAGDLFTDQHLLSLLTLCKLAHEAHSEMLRASSVPGRARAGPSYLGLATDPAANTPS